MFTQNLLRQVDKAILEALKTQPEADDEDTKFALSLVDKLHRFQGRDKNRAHIVILQAIDSFEEEIEARHSYHHSSHPPQSMWEL